MSTINRKIAEILSTLTAFKQQLGKDRVDSALVYLDSATEKMQELAKELRSDD